MTASMPLPLTLPPSSLPPVDRSLFKNNLTRIPPELGQLTYLPRLSLYENQITEVPPELGNMSGLMEL